MNSCTLCRGTSFVLAVLSIISTTGTVAGQERSRTQASVQGPLCQYVVVLKPGPKWIQGRSVLEQPLLEHGRYLQGLMNQGALQLAGPFLDNTGGLILLNVTDESQARQIVEHDPGVLAQILQPEMIRPFQSAFDATTGKSPFKK